LDRKEIFPMPPTHTVAVSAEVELLRRRVDELEVGLAALRNALQARDAQPARQPWWEEHSGAFAGDPGFEEMVDLGRQWRDAQREEARTDCEPGPDGAEAPG
jgi:hypothetical protein